MTITVIIASHNRSDQLLETLHHARALTAVPDHPAELLVVDNASTDGTASVLRRFAESVPVTLLHEPNPGKSNALNQAISVAKGELLVFTDDDVTVTPAWLEALAHAAESHPGHDFFGGKVHSQWSTEPPRWFRENYRWLGLTPTRDYGEEMVECRPENRRFFLGANLAIRRRVFAAGLRFDPDFGPKLAFGSKDSRHGSEDWLIQHEMLAAGYTGLYVPGAIVHHRDDPVRMTKSYLRWYYENHAREEILSGGVDDSGVHWAGAPRHLWRTAIESALKWSLSRWSRPSNVWLRHEVAFLVARSQILAFRGGFRSAAAPDETRTA